MTAAILLALADRCEREEPSEKLREEIAIALGWKDEPFHWVSPEGIKWQLSPPDWLCSLDAAVTLVPRNFLWAAGWALRGGGYTARVSDLCGVAGEGAAPSAVQCICAAALRARAAMEKAETERAQMGEIAR